MSPIHWVVALPIIQANADRVVLDLRMIPRTKDEFLGAAVSWMFERAHRYDPARSQLKNWSYVVLRNHGVSIIRRHASERKQLEILREVTAYERSSMQRRVSARREPDNPPDIDVIDRLEQLMNAEDRLFLTIDSRLADGLDSERLARWLRQANLPSNFDWRRLVAIEDQADRRKALAAAFNRDVRWLRQRINRALEKLRNELDHPEVE